MLRRLFRKRKKNEFPTMHTVELYPGEVLAGSYSMYPSQDEMMTLINTGFSLYQYSNSESVTAEIAAEGVVYDIKINIKVTKQ